MARRAKKKPAQRAWQQMEEYTINPAYMAAVYPNGLASYDVVRLQAFANDIYSVTVEHFEDGLAHISLKRFDRHAVRDWRHLQAIKNECVGPEREAIELFPAESRLMDEANQYHLYVLPEGARLPFGQGFRTVVDADTIAAQKSKARQRPWQPGLPTGVNAGGESLPPLHETREVA